jgi:DNA-binding Lrp family transcriptional regulator
VSSRLEADEDAERYVLVRETVEDGTAVRNGTRPSAAMRRPTRSGTGRRATASRNGKTDRGTSEIDSASRVVLLRHEERRTELGSGSKPRPRPAENRTASSGGDPSSENRSLSRPAIYCVVGKPYSVRSAGVGMDEQRDLLELLTTNARESTANLARQLGTSEAAVEEAIVELEREGVVRGYQAVVDWERADVNHVEAEVELNVDLDRETSYGDIADRIVKFPQVRALRLVSGNYDFSVDVQGESMHDVSAFVSEQIAPIPEVTQTVTHFVMDTYKEGGVEFGDRDEDDRLSVSP